MEQKKKRWIVLDEKGRFRKISINHTLGLEIGDQMEVEEAKLQMNWRGAMAIVTAMLVIFSGWLYQVPYGFMVVDINPSTELVYNRFQRVLRVNPLNEDAEGLVRIQLKHRSLEFAVEEVVAAAEEAGFLEKDGYVLLTNQEKKNRIDEEGFVEDLYQAMLDDGMDLTIAALEVTENEYHYAKGIGVSPGKEILREQIKFQKGEIKEAGGSVGALIREVNRVTKPTKDEKDSARLIMQEEKRTRNNEESNAGQDRGQSQKGKDKTPPGQAKKEENSVDVEPRSENEDQTNGKGSPGGNGSAGNAGSSQNDGNSENDGNSGDSGNNGGDGSSKGNN
jgi:hypothetical protein